jgi:hypothetical protein
MKMILISILVVMGFGCNTNNHRKAQDVTDSTYIKSGDSIVQKTFDTLRKTLLITIDEKGLSGAIRFCNIEALPVTSMYASSEISVSRVTDKTRNPKNALREKDTTIWKDYKTAFAKKDSLRSQIINTDGEVHYYKPITMQPMCLNCHGTPGKELAAEQIRIIDSLYPADQAKGYKTGDLRGMWHIVFNIKSR